MVTSGQKGPRVLELLEGAGQGLLSLTSWPPLCSCQRPSPLQKACRPGATSCPGGVHQQETGLGALDAHGLQPSESQTSKEGAARKLGFSMGGGAGRGSAPRGLGRQGAWADAEAGFALLESQSFGLCGVSRLPKLAPLWTSGQMPQGGALLRRARVAGLENTGKRHAQRGTLRCRARRPAQGHAARAVEPDSLQAEGSPSSP